MTQSFKPVTVGIMGGSASGKTTFAKALAEELSSLSSVILHHIVAENGADGLETMTPPDMGGDCDLAEASRRVGDRLFFIGGFDQNRGFEQGTPEIAAKMVRELHAACPNGGYICCPSDHFFFGSPENVQAFVDTATQCKY